MTEPRRTYEQTETGDPDDRPSEQLAGVKVVVPGYFKVWGIDIETIPVTLDIDANWSSELSDYAIAHLVLHQRDGGEPISGRLLRSVALGAAQEYAKFVALQAHANSTHGRWAAVRSQLDTLAPSLRAAGPTPETLDWVGTLYEFQTLLGNAPKKAVQLTFDLPESTAAHWVRLARQRGHIGVAPRKS
jgi:hypothetical protein